MMISLNQIPEKTDRLAFRGQALPKGRNLKCDGTKTHFKDTNIEISAP